MLKNYTAFAGHPMMNHSMVIFKLISVNVFCLNCSNYVKMKIIFNHYQKRVISAWSNHDFVVQIFQMRDVPFIHD